MEVRLRPRGVGRYFGAVFLAFWLCGWAVGEVFALGLVAHGLLAWISGSADASQLSAGAAAGAFLLVWLPLWTLGGVAAATHLLRELWGEDRLVAAPDGLRIEWRAGPFRRRRTLERAEIEQVALHRRGWLVIETARERVEASRLGSASERSEAVAALRRELGLGDAARAFAPALPVEWAELLTPEGVSALVKSPATRRIQVVIVSVLMLIALAITSALLRAAADDSGSFESALLALAVSLALGAWVVWLVQCRNEWRIERGALVLQRRFGERVTEQFRATRLALTQRADSDGDDWYELEAHGEAVAQRSIVRRMNDDAVPRRLGLWLAGRSGIPLDDRTGEVTARADLAQLRAQLEASGPLGRLVNRWIGRSEGQQPPR